MKKYRVIFEQIHLPSDFIGDAMCPACGDADRRAEYGEPCRFCGHSEYQPCLEVEADWFGVQYDDSDREHLESLGVQDETNLGGFYPELSSIIRIA